MTDNAHTLAEFMELVWNRGDIAAVDRVVVAWRMLGTQTGAMGPIPLTGRRIAVQGMTVYYFRGGRIAGHRQVVDRLAVAQQLGLGGPRAPASAESLSQPAG